MRMLPRLLAILLFLALWAQPVTAQEATPIPVVGSVSGTIENLTAGAEPPVDAPVTLYALEGFDPVATYTTTVASSGGFEFTDVALIEGLSYIVTLEYHGVSYGSAFSSYDGFGDTLLLDVEVYEATSEIDQIGVSRMHVIIDFSGNNLLISELYLFDNLSDRVYVGPTGVPTDGTLELPLPDGAIDPVVERGMGESMVPTSSSVYKADGGFVDTLPVRPGMASQQLMVTYQLPYDERHVTVSHPLPYPVQSISLFVPDVGLAVESDQLSGGVVQAMSGVPMLQWDGVEIEAGDILSFTLSGEPDMSGLVTESVAGAQTMSGSPNPHLAQPADSALFVAAGDNSITWTIGAGALAIAAVVVGFAWFRRPIVHGESSREALLEAVVQLDSAWEAGEIPTARYEWARERLKGQLRGFYTSEDVAIR